MTGWADHTPTPRTPAQLEAIIRADAAALSGGVYNVKSSTYGAVGDGVTDDTDAIQAALDDAYEAGGGVVLIPPGLYMVSGLEIGSYVTLRGSGIEATTIKLIAGTVGDLLKTRDFDILTGTNPVDLSAGGTNVGAVKYHLRDIKLNANCANPNNDPENAGDTRGWVLRSFGVAFTIDHVEFWFGSYGGIYSEWRSTTGGKDMETIVSNFKVKDISNAGAAFPPDPPEGPGSFGICWNGPHDTFFCNGVVATLNSDIRPENLPCSVAIKTQGPNLLWDGTEEGSGIAGGASGEVFVNVHTWGRWHVGWWPTAQFFAANCIAEGAFQINVIMNTGSVWVGGTVYGNNGSGESGFMIGTQADVPHGTDAFNSSRSIIHGVYLNNFGAGSVVFHFANTAGNNSIKAVVQLGNATMYDGAIFPTGDHLEIQCHDHANRSLNTQPKYVRFNDGFNIKTKAGPPTAADFGYADYPTIDTSLGASWLHGALTADSTSHKMWLQLSGVWYSTATMRADTEPQILHGAGTPEGAVTAPVGSTYQRTNGGAGTSFYVKESGAGNTGWVAK